MNVEVIKEVFNKRNELKTKVVKITNKQLKKGLTIDTINELYNDLLAKYKADQMLITAVPMTGNMVTLKSYLYTETDLKYSDEAYFNSKPKEIKQKLSGRYISVIITIKL